MKRKFLFFTISLFILLFFTGNPGFSQRVFPYKTKGLWGLIDENQKVILKPVFFEIIKILPYEKLIFYTDSMNAKGICDFNGNIKLKPDVKYSSFNILKSDFLEIKNLEDKAAIYDYNRKEFLSDFSFQKLINFFNDSLLLVSNGNDKGLYNINLKKVQINILYQDIEYLMTEYLGGGSMSKECLKLKKSDKTAIYNLRKNTFVTDFLFEEIKALFPDNTIAVEKGIKRALYGLKERKFLSDSLFGYIQYLSDYIYIVKSKKGLSGVYDFKKNKYVISGQKYIQPLYLYGDKSTKYIQNETNRQFGVYDVALKKQIIPQEYEWISMKRTYKVNDKTKKKTTLLLFACIRDRYNYDNIIYFDGSGTLVSKDFLAKSGIDIEADEIYGDAVDLEDMGEGADDYRKLNVTIKKSGNKEYKIVLGQFPKDTFRISGYDTIIKFSSISDDKYNYYRPYNNNPNDTILIGKKVNQYQLITYKGSIAYPFNFDSLQLFPHRTYDRVFLYYKDKKFGIINLGTKLYVSKAIFSSISFVKEFSLTYPYFVGSVNNEDAFIINLNHGIIYHPDIKLEMLKKSN